MWAKIRSATYPQARANATVSHNRKQKQLWVWDIALVYLNVHHVLHDKPGQIAPSQSISEIGRNERETVIRQMHKVTKSLAPEQTCRNPVSV
jgi:hypothetical protein